VEHAQARSEDRSLPVLPVRAADRSDLSQFKMVEIWIADLWLCSLVLNLTSIMLRAFHPRHRLSRDRVDASVGEPEM